MFMQKQCLKHKLNLPSSQSEGPLMFDNSIILVKADVWLNGKVGPLVDYMIEITNCVSHLPVLAHVLFLIKVVCNSTRGCCSCIGGRTKFTKGFSLTAGQFICFNRGEFTSWFCRGSEKFMRNDWQIWRIPFKQWKWDNLENVRSGFLEFNRDC